MSLGTEVSRESRGKAPVEGLGDQPPEAEAYLLIIA